MIHVEGKNRAVDPLATSPTVNSGLAAFTLPRSSLENQKKPERARLGAFGSLAFFCFRLLGVPELTPAS